MTAGLPGGAQAPAIVAARALVAALVGHGVRDVVLAPGSRSAPLAYALAAADDDGALTLHVRIDERSAAFLALGLSRGAALADGGDSDDDGDGGHDNGVRAPRPVAVVTTSGTAVANLHPAVLEAHHTGIPLVLLTADRPHELRGTGASQTTDQVGIFGASVRYQCDVAAPDGRAGEVRDLLATTTRALAAALGLRDGHPGPVHLNLAYREPLQPAEEPAMVADPAALTGYRPTVVARGAAEVGGDPVLTGDPAHTVVVAGDGAGPGARALAQAQAWPLLAEPSSGACGGPNAIRAYRSVLGVDELAVQIRHVVVYGHPTLSRPVGRLLARPDVDVTVVAPGGGPWPDAARNATAVVGALHPRWFVPATTGASAFLTAWREASRAAAVVVDRVSTPGPGRLDDSPFAALAVARAVAAATGPDDVLVVGSSNPVRDLDLVLGLDGETGPVLANRGLAGIDGTISTAFGVAHAGRRPGRRTRALLGDLTFLHDVGGLLRGPHEPAAGLQLVVVNDDGGSIFATIEHGDLAASSPAAARTFERVFGTPHGVDLGPVCAAYGVRHHAVGDLAGLRAALAAPADGVEVVEVRVARGDRREESRTLHREVMAAVRSVEPSPA